jgi:hypothetical protein
MFLEFDWMVGVYKPRFGTTFTDVDGHRSFECLEDARYALATCNLMLGRKTDSRTWEIIVIPAVAEREARLAKQMAEDSDADWRWTNDWD